MSICMYICVNMCMHVCIYVYMCLCICICICLSVCLYVHLTYIYIYRMYNYLHINNRRRLQGDHYTEHLQKTNLTFDRPVLGKLLVVQVRDVCLDGHEEPKLLPGVRV